MRRFQVALFGALLLAGSPGNLISQVVRGQVTNRTSGLPVGGGFVVLLDSAGGETARALSDALGRFVLSAPAAGTYLLQSKRIGFRPSVSAPITLEAHQTREYAFEVEAVPLALPGLVVTGRPRCGAVEGPMVAELWDEIREALAAVSWTSRQPYRYEKALYEREFDLMGRSVRRERTQRRSGFFETPFRSAPPQRLVQDGYVVPEGNTRVFYGPDVDAVRSASFIQTHCFKAVAGAGRDAGLVGLAFEPVRQRELTDISGTLWVDRATAELRRLEFRYVNLPHDLQGAALGGEVAFLALPSGGWIVRDWWIRTPLRGWVETFTEREVRVVGLEQTGGRVLRILANGQTVYAADLATLSGTVVDETRGAPLGGAKVQLLETPYRAIADGAGRFALTGTMEGEYQVTFAHPRLDSVAYTPAVVTVALQSGEVASLRLTLPAESVIVAQLCPDSLPAESHVLHGTVRDHASRSPAAAAEVRATWQDIRGWAPGMPLAVEGRLRPFVLRERGAVVTTDSLGKYLMCGVPRGRRITVGVVHQGQLVATTSLQMQKEGTWLGESWVPDSSLIRRHDMTFRYVLGDLATVVAVATDATSGAPLANAIVSLTGVNVQGVTDHAGRVMLGQVPPGTHTLVVRRIGYEVLERAVAVPSADTVHLPAGTLALTAIPFVLDTVVATGALEGARWLEVVGFLDRRKAGLGDFITRQEFEPYVPSGPSDVLRRLHAINVRPNPNYGKPHPRRPVLDWRRWIIESSRGGVNCPPLLFLDGAYLGNALDVDFDDVIAVNQIEAVEAYNGASNVPVAFASTGSQCGVVVFWTRH